MENFEEAMWLTVSGLGDRDTTCAIVGSIVALYADSKTIPKDWHENREPLKIKEWMDTGLKLDNNLLSLDNYDVEGKVHPHMY